MNAAIVDGIVKAVLYEGYMLYPYRPSAVKNRQRFNFGVLYPRAYSEAQGGTDACTMQTECLAQGNEETECLVRVRFLHMVERSIGKLPLPVNQWPVSRLEGMEAVERLETDGEVFQAWQEAVEEVIEVAGFNPASLAGQRMQWPFRLSARQEKEPIRDRSGLVVGILVRDKAAVAGTVELSAEGLEPNLWKLTIRVSNDVTAAEARSGRAEALARSLVSTHTILQLRGGEFVSLVDPPETRRNFAAKCRNIGTWPVLVGSEGERDAMLSSPIILYDYPQIAPESPGDLFDGGEIDEILSLRILTMTDQEKAEMRRSDARARQILERTEALPEKHLRKLHGALRGLRPVQDRGGV